jgi:hypothetical protein
VLEQHWHQYLALATFVCFFMNPIGFDRSFGPGDDNALGFMEGATNVVSPCAARGDGSVPKYRPTFGLKRFSERLRARLIFVSVA